jgi:hypothetical protein
MTTSPNRLFLALLLTLASRPVLAEHEGPDAHSHGTTQTITLDGNDIRPSTITIGHGDVISFVNYSIHPIQVTFTEPADIAQRIHCSLVHSAKTKGTPSPPWAVFIWTNEKLVGNVPPGRFASVCSLEPGNYAFTAQIVGQSPRAADRGSVLASKGRIEVK